MAQGHQFVTVSSTGCGFNPHSRKLNVYLNFYFYFCCGVEAKSGVQFRDSICNAFKIHSENGTECLNTSFLFYSGLLHAMDD